METFTDPRDGETYKIVQIGNLVWFAENSRYQGVEHRFPNRNSDNLQRCGCLYTWENAMKACPEGWRLPTKTDFNNLLSYVDKHKSNNSTKFLSLIANSKTLTNYSNKGLDEFGFGALLAGYYSGNYYGFDYYSFFWSSTEYSSFSAYYLDLDNNYVDIYSGDKTVGFSVRCIKEV